MCASCQQQLMRTKQDNNIVGVYNLFLFREYLMMFENDEIICERHSYDKLASSYDNGTGSQDV
jgi:hypothetical protein